MSRNPNQTGFSRVFIIKDRASPSNTPQYQGLGRAGAVAWPQGDVTLIRVPSELQYDQFDTIGKYRGDKGSPSIPLTFRYTMDRSTMLQIARTGCDLDAQIHMGKCGDPRDFNGGWEKILVLEGAAITSYGTGDLGTLEPSGRAMVNEEIPLTGEDLYEILRQTYAIQDGPNITAEVLDVVICDAVTCGACGLSSDGCQVVFALTEPNAGSPGLGGEIIFSQNGGGTWGDALIDSALTSETGVAMACVGTRLAVTIGGATGGVHYASIASILAGTDVWTKNASGLTLPTGAPRAIVSKSPAHTWVFGAGGYIYFYSDITAAPTVQDAGGITTQQYNAGHALDSVNVVAVGNSNVVSYTTNGGSTWALVVGPAVGINLNAVWMKTEQEWLVGTANGKLFFTRNRGVSWTEIASFTGTGTGVINDISFANRTVGYMAHTVGGVGFVLRTIDGGKSWYRTPEVGIMPAGTQQFNAVFACVADPNVVFAGGLGVGTDGVLVKGA